MQNWGKQELLKSVILYDIVFYFLDIHRQNYQYQPSKTVKKLFKTCITLTAVLNSSYSFAKCNKFPKFTFFKQKHKYGQRDQSDVVPFVRTHNWGRRLKINSDVFHFRLIMKLQMFHHVSHHFLWPETDAKHPLKFDFLLVFYHVFVSLSRETTTTIISIDPSPK